VVSLNTRFAFWLASGAVIFAVTVAGCQKKEEPVPAANTAPAVPAASAPSDARAVASAPTGGDKGADSSAATGETETPEKQEAGKTTF